MKLYLLSQGYNDGYDTYDSILVCAEDEDDAKTINPDGTPFVERKMSTWTDTIDQITCKEIGEANDKQTRGVIIASFNAG
jgi:hypothetical protein